LQWPTPAESTKNATLKAVNVEEIVSQFRFDNLEDAGQAPNSLVPKSQTSASPVLELSNYENDAKRIVACAKQLSMNAGSGTAGFTPEVTENLAAEIQRIANADLSARGSAYVANAVTTFCAAANRSELVEFKKRNPEKQVFEMLINHHLSNWDTMVRERVFLEKVANYRLSSESFQSEARLSSMTSKLLLYLLIAVGSLGLFVLIAIYAAYRMIGWNFRNVFLSIESLKAGEKHHLMDAGLVKISLADEHSA
jgi:hypothetical protein